MKKKGSNIGSFLNVWGILAIITTIGTIIGTIISIIFWEELLELGNGIPRNHPCYDLYCMLCDFCDEFDILIILILIAPLFLFVASYYLWSQAIEYRNDKIVEQEEKKRNEKKKMQKAEARKLQTKLDNMIKEHSSDKTYKD